jgi:hypothetical protein
MQGISRVHLMNRLLAVIQPAWLRWLFGFLLSVTALVMSELRQELVLALLPLVIAATIGTIATSAFNLRLALQRIASNRRAAFTFLFVWAAIAISLVTFLADNRDIHARLLSSDSVRYYPLTVAGSPEPTIAYLGSFVGRDDWLVRWNSGEIFFAELGFALAVILVIVGVGYLWGDHAVTLWMVLSVLAFSLVVHVSFHELVLRDYDTFIGGIYSPALVFQMIIPIAPSTTAMLVALGFHLGGLIATLISDFWSELLSAKKHKIER